MATNRTHRPRAPIAPAPRPWWADTDQPAPCTTRPAHDAMAELAATPTLEEEIADAFGDVIIE